MTTLAGPAAQVAVVAHAGTIVSQVQRNVTPFQPYTPLSPMRALYRSVAQVQRLQPTMTKNGSMSVSWALVTDLVDPIWGVAGQLQCRLDLGFTRPGRDIPAPMVAGRAPDRFGVMYFDCATDNVGRLLVRANDRFVMVSGPVYGTFEVRVVPEVAQDYVGAHHVEIQVIEVSQALTPGSITPFPGSPA